VPVDPAVPPLAVEGGAGAGGERLARFVREGLPRYAERRSQPGSDASSGLSPWLHFGHVSAHEVFAEVARWEGWTPARLAPAASGKKQGWWGLGASAEAFLDELVTWRELGYVCAFRRPREHASYAGLPEWSRATLAKHARDRREHLYPLDELERAETHDEVWNAAQRELRSKGRIDNYLRMLWGKKVLEWSATPEAAFDALVELNNRWAIDGRDPNSYSGIAWCLGRFDRPWGPERAVFGTVRYMSSENTRRKLDLGPYLARWGA
jgi:deoxyribodipyrimidine photo-lyase